MPKTTLRKKIFLIIFGIFLLLVFLEVCLRIGSFIVLSYKQYKNSQAIRQKGSYSILCLGDSFTLSGYPDELAMILNEKLPRIKFRVINEGVPGGTSESIVLNLEENLKKYHPDMVIVMMGLNDRFAEVPFQNNFASRASRMLEGIKVYKLAKYLWMDIGAMAEGKTNITSDNFDTCSDHGPEANLSASRQKENMFKKAIELNSKNEWGYIELGRCYIEQKRFSEAEEVFKKALEIDSNNERVYIGLGRCYIEQKRFSEAEGMFRKAIEIGPENDWATIGMGRYFYRETGEVLGKMFTNMPEKEPKESWVYIGLGRLYIEQKRFREAESMFKKAIEFNPKNEWGYIGLGWYYLEHELYGGNHRDKINKEVLNNMTSMFKKAIELNSKNEWGYIELGRCYIEQKRFSEAEEVFKKALEIAPNTYVGYIALGEYYIEQKRFSEAEGMFRKALDIDPKNIRAYGGLAFSYEERKDFEQAKKLFAKANRLRMENFNPITYLNYQKIAAILNRKGIMLVCPQYPACSIEPLKRIFNSSQEGVILVDNEMIFKNAIREKGYSEYFKDNCGGDFGHPTEKGRQLIANNIADTLIKTVFNKR